MPYNLETNLKKAQKNINSGNFNEANRLVSEVLVQYPDQLHALQLKGFIALQTNNLEMAINTYSHLLTITPNNASFEYNLGLAYLRSAQFEPAATHLENTVKIAPNLHVAYSDFSLALIKCNRFEAAVTIGKIAVEKTPDNPGAHYNLALACDRLKDYETSLKHYEITNKLLPDHAGVQSDLGNAYTAQGKKNEARTCYEKVLKVHPLNAPTYRNLTRITKYSSTDHKDVIALKKILNTPGVTDDHKTDALFALGKIYQDCKLYDEAFSYFLKGNKLHDEKLQFDPEEFTNFVTKTIQNCNTELFSKKDALGNQSQKPIFIIGTPRSGTTLVEQIISSHPQVFGAGELEWFDAACSSLTKYIGSDKEFPECLSEIEKSHIDELANKYMTYISNLSSGEPLVTDKMPANFLLLGLIRILYPNAKIIHCMRNFKDACISMYTQFFPDCVPFSYDLYKLGIFYAQYERLMQHWRDTLPENSMFEIKYEDMVSNQEEESRKIIKFLGLDWDDACLSFYKSKRRVHTASDMQVSKPVYKSSVERWKRYEKHLGDLDKGYELGKTLS